MTDFRKLINLSCNQFLKILNNYKLLDVAGNYVSSNRNEFTLQIFQSTKRDDSE